MSTIDVSDRFVVHEDDVFAFKDETGFQLDGDGAPDLVNGGRLSLSKTTADSGIALVAALADGSMVWNQATGTLRVKSADDGGFGMWVEGVGATLRNDGRCLFESGGSIVGALAEGIGTTFANHGIWRVEATGTAGGGYLFCDSAVNTGTVSVESRDSAAFGFYVPGRGGGEFRNAGLIKVLGFDGASGVSLYDAAPSYRFVNTGRIVAASSSFPSIGVTTPAVGVGVIENAGVIRADHAIWSAFNDEGQTVLNSGALAGDVLLAAAADKVVNSGVIRGEVNLEDGFEHYDGHDGVLRGVLWGGQGDDTLIGGRAGEEIHGDESASSWFDGADLLKGGGGDDSLSGGGGGDTLRGGTGADLLHGEASADLLVGGKGADVFAFGALSDSAPDGADTIASLHADDRIDLSSIDADPDTPGDQAFTADQVTLAFDKSSGATRIEVDADHDEKADFVLIVDAGRVSFDQLVL